MSHVPGLRGRRLPALLIVAMAMAIIVGLALRPAPGAHASHNVPVITLVSISTDFNGPIGIDHHEPSNSLVISANYPSGLPSNLELVDELGVHAPHSALAGATDELKIGSVRTSACMQTFLAGQVFTGNGVAGQIVRVSPDGSTVTNPWVTLPGEPGLMRGSLFQDRYCVAGGDLIVVTTVGNVWRVTSAGVPTLVKALGVHLEGLTTVPNLPAEYGPWAGKILAGAEGQFNVWAIDPDTGVSVAYQLPIANAGNALLQPEDIDIIPENENFFGVGYATGTLWGAPASEFDGAEGDILFAQEFPGRLVHVHWNSLTEEFEANQIAVVTQWEHVTFSPAGVVELPAVTDAVDDEATTNEDTDVVIPVLDNDAGVDIVITVTTPPSDGSITVNLDGTITYSPNDNFCGEDTFTYTIEGENGTDTATVTVDVNCVNDNPVCTAAAPSIVRIWPPNHKMVPVSILGVTDIDGGAIVITITSIWQDEPVNTVGDGNTAPDGAGVGTSTAEVRAERSGTKKVPGDGRVYHIGFSASDGNGGSCSGTVRVGVPHDQGGQSVPIDGGALYNSTLP